MAIILTNIIFSISGGLSSYYFIIIYKSFDKKLAKDEGNSYNKRIRKIKQNPKLFRTILICGPISFLIFYFSWFHLQALHSLSISNPKEIHVPYEYIIEVFVVLTFTILIIKSLIKIIKDILELSSEEYSIHQNYIIYLVMSTLSSLVIIFAFISHMLYQDKPQYYVINTFKNDIETAFEFLYYSFSVGITLGSNSIEPANILTKFLLMYEVVIFYFVIGQGILGIVNAYKISKSNKI